MKSVSLYIDGNRVDLNGEELIMFNYTQEDLSNPTVVKNSYSNKIKIAGTRNNNRIFSHVFRLDSRIDVGFDPMAKTPFELYDETGSLLESGYIKLDEVSRQGKDIEYSITMYGGLGSFFYGLTYDDEGNKISLADLKFLHHDGSVKQIESKVVNKETLLDAWSYFENRSIYFDSNPSAAWDLINFAPCYNGTPEDFDADKVLMNRGYAQMSKANVVDGATYTKKEGCSTVLVKLGKKHTEWELKNIRPYLQRVVVSIKAIIDAINFKAQEQGFVVTWDESFINENPVYTEGWITLGMIPKTDRNTSNAIKAVLQASLTPCDYIVTLAKMYGLVFSYDNYTKQVSIMQRSSFYERNAGNVIDLTDRIDSQSLTIKPFLMEAKWYQLGSKVVGEYAESYEKEYGRKYAVQKINTGHSFNSEVKELTKDLPFIEAADVAENSYLYAGYYRASGFYWVEVFPFPIYEEVNMQLFKDGVEDDQKDIPMNSLYTRAQAFDSNHPFVDWLPKVQFHGEDNKPIDGSNCVLFFNGSKETPYLAGPSKRWTYVVTDDHPDMETLNSGKQCWNLDFDVASGLTKLPSFRRMYLEGTKPYKVKSDLGWGVPFERAVVDIAQDPDNPHTLYADRWRQYLTDRYDENTKVLKCKVNLNGMAVNQDLLSRFFWYEGSYWVLNKVSNYSILTDDLVDCEFIRVNEISRYAQGQF